MSQKFHINSAGDVRVCNATVKPCRFGESDHFTDRAEARKEVEERLSKEHSSVSTQTKKMLKESEKDTSVEKNQKVSIDKIDTSEETISLNSKFANNHIEQIKSAISIIAKKENPTSEDFQNLGKLFESEVKSRYAFDPFNKELEHSEYVEIGVVNRQLLSEIVTTGSDLPNVSIDGPMKSSLQQSVKFLPDAAKNLIRDRYIQATRISAKNKSAAQHKYSMLKIPREAKITVNSSYIPEKAADGDLFMPKAYPKLAELEHPGNSTLLHVKNGSETQLKTYWLGKTLRDKNYSLRKVSNNARVFINGEYVTIEKPLYEVFGYDSRAGSEISGPKAENERIEALWVHEYTHALQQKTLLPKYEDEMFEKFAKETTFSHDYGEIVHKGFPNEYMGHRSKRELFPTSTEGFFYPNGFDREFFYGKDRKENADELRRWTIGLWLALGQK